MTAKMMPGGPVADAVFADLVPRSEKLIANGHTPGLGTILVGDDGASARYVGMKMEKAQELGWTSPHLHLPESATQADVLAAVRRVQRRPRGRRVPHPTPDAPADRLRRRAAGDGSRQGRRRDAPGQHGAPGAHDAGAGAGDPGRHRGAARVLRDPGGGPRGLHPRSRHDPGPPARAAPVAEAPDGQRRGHGRAHRGAELARLHAPRRHRRGRRRRARHPATRAHHPGGGRRRGWGPLRGSASAPRRRRVVRSRWRARSRPGSAAWDRRPSPCSSATRSRPPSAEHHERPDPRTRRRSCRARCAARRCVPTPSAVPSAT